jgi:hypothetical protein
MSQLSPQDARALNQSHMVGLLGVVAVGMILFLPSIVALLAGWHQVLFWPALLGGATLLVGSWKLLDWARRDSPPAYSVQIDERGIEGCWAGRPPVKLSWQAVTKIVPNAGGFLVMAGTKSVLVPAQIPDARALHQRALELRGEAPPPDVEVQVGLDGPAPVPLDEHRSRRIEAIDHVRPWLGWGVLPAAGLALLGFVDPRLAGVFGGLAVLLAGLWYALTYGVRTWILGVAVSRSFVVVKTTHRGARARVMAVMHGLVGGCMVALGGMVLAASIAVLITGIPG